MDPQPAAVPEADPAPPVSPPADPYVLLAYPDLKPASQAPRDFL
jgi:hypothetical protein